MYSPARFEAQGIQPRLAAHDHAALDAWIAQTSTVCQAMQAATSLAELGSSSSKIKALRSQQDAMLIRVPETAVSKYLLEASTALQQLCAALGHGLRLGSCTQLLQDEQALQALVKAGHLIWIMLQGVVCFTTEISAGRLDPEPFAGCDHTCMQAVEGSGLLAAFTTLGPAMAAILSPVEDAAAVAGAAEASSSSSHLQDAAMQLSEGLIHIWTLSIQINHNTPPFQPDTWGPTLLPMAGLIAAVVRAWRAREHSGGGGSSSSSSNTNSTRSSRKKTAKRDKQIAAAAAARAAQESAFGPVTPDNMPPARMIGFIADHWRRTSSAAMQAGMSFIAVMRSGWSHDFFFPVPLPRAGAAAGFRSWLAALRDIRQQPRADQPSSLLHLMLLMTAFLAARLHSDCQGRSAVPAAAAGPGKVLPAGSSSEQGLAIPACHELLLAAVDPASRKAYTSTAGFYSLSVAQIAFAHLFGDGSGPLASCSASPSSSGPPARWLYSSSRQEVVASVLLLVEVSLLEPKPELVSCWLRVMHELLQAHWRCLELGPAQGGSWEGAAEVLPALLLHLAPAVAHLLRSQDASGADVVGDLTSSLAVLVCRLLVLVPPGQLPQLLGSLLEQPQLAWQGLELAVRAAQDSSRWGSLHTITALFQAATPANTTASSRGAPATARPALRLSQAAVQLGISSLKRAAAMAAASPDAQPPALGAVGCSLLAGLGSLSAGGAAGSSSAAGNEELPGLVLLTARTLHSVASVLVSAAAAGAPAADGTPPGSSPAGAAELAGQYLSSVEWLGSKLALLHLPGDAEQRAAALAKLQQKQRKALRALQQLLQQEQQQAPGSGASAAEGGGAGAAAAEQLQQFAALVCVQLPTTLCCNSPACLSLAGPSEAQLVSGKECICSGCKAARYCSRDCQTAHWPQHRSVCKVLKRGG